MSELEAAGAPAPGVNPAAVGVALTGASRDKADLFLDNQNVLINDQRRMLHMQMEEMREENPLKLSHLRWRRFTDQMKGALQIMTALVGLTAAVAVGAVVRNAAHSEGLIIESFSVPPDMAARGVTGQMVASQMLDRLTVMQDLTRSFRPARSYANNWGNDIKVEIPETGVSVGEIQHFLKNWLGHDTRISGEVYRTATGIAVTARSGSNTGATFTGADSDLDALVQKAAEHVYSQTQPTRYANYLDRNPDPVGLADRRARAAAIYQRLSEGPDEVERAWAFNGLGSQAVMQQQRRLAIDYYRKAIAAAPDLPISYAALSFQERFGDNRESALTGFATLLRLMRADTSAGLNPIMFPATRLNMATQIAMLKGDFGEAARNARERAELHAIGPNMDYIGAESDVLWALASQHDPGGVRAYLRELGLSRPHGNINRWMTYAALGDWQSITAMADDVLRRRSGSTEDIGTLFDRAPAVLAVVAEAMIHQGDLKGAEALIARTPGDCDGCLLMRARMAEMHGQHDRADYWFARDVARTPSFPFAAFEWGKVLLARGKPDAAIDKFTLANQKGPKFADPLEGWGEALMAKNQSHLALAKFVEAEKYAPNWGRLYLKWGQALAYSGNKAEAAKHFARAAQLDLTPSEKAELARHP